MTPSLWRVFAVLTCVLSLYCLAGDAAYSLTARSTQGFSAEHASKDRVDAFRVTKVDDPSTASPPLHAGDVIRLHDDSLDERVRYGLALAGSTFVFDRTSGGPTPVTVTLRRLGPPPAQIWVYQILHLALVGVALLLAVRRPRDPAVRALANMLIALSLILTFTFAPGTPSALALILIAVLTTANVLGGYFALQLACTFPQRSTHGPRRWLERVNPWVAAAGWAFAMSATAAVTVWERRPPEWVHVAAFALTFFFYASTTVAFFIAHRETRGADLRRLRWVSFSLAAGFSGVFVATALIAAHQTPDWIQFLALTLVAIPAGLGYAIVRHRVVDIGFVVNRAIVFGTISGFVLLAFGALEWVLSNTIVRVSHITSTSLELALALVLGFSLREIHRRVDGFVDELFFRERHAAERALRTFARDVGFINDPAVAVARAQVELVTRCGADDGAVYLVHGPDAVRVDPGEGPAPAQVDLDDPAFVRLRASRTHTSLRGLASALRAELAFPMFVRGAFVGAVVLGAKSSGEAYAPDEIATIDAVVTALGIALDAMQTEALREEIAHVLAGGSIEDLRGLHERGALPGRTAQPPRPLAGLTE